jgi:hypothetical protein
MKLTRPKPWPMADSLKELHALAEKFEATASGKKLFAGVGAG